MTAVASAPVIFAVVIGVAKLMIALLVIGAIAGFDLGQQSVVTRPRLADRTPAKRRFVDQTCTSCGRRARCYPRQASYPNAQGWVREVEMANITAIKEFFEACEAGKAWEGLPRVLLA
jgi:hypothetical protein